jgi:hypothetical protein
MSNTAPALLDALISALESESDALVRDDVARLTQLAQKKDDLLRRLLPQLQALPQAERPLEQLREAARRNDLNAMLLAPQVTGNRARADALRRAARQDSTYGASGRITAAAPSHAHATLA